MNPQNQTVAPRLTRRSSRRRTRPLMALLGIAVAATGVQALATESAQAVVGGSNVFAGDYPFLAQVNNTAVSGLCTGTLINPSWVLTAVHCSVPTTTGDMTVRVNNRNYGTGGEMRRVQRILTNPAYTGGHNDVALLELSSPITDVPVARLGTPAEAYAWDGVVGGPFTNKDQADVVGWGSTKAGATVIPSIAQVRGVFVSPQLRDGANIPYIPTDGGPCLGDSGGPLLSKTNTGETVISGILKSADCATSGTYSIVGNGPNRDWILSVITGVRYTAFGTVDYDRDGNQDIVTRDNANGDLWLYPGQSVRGYSTIPRVKIGNGWNGFTPFGLADYDNDGNPDILVRQDTTGTLRLYPGQGNRGYSTIAPITIGSGFAERTPFGTADWDKDGKKDVVARDDSTGDLYLYPGPGSRSALVTPRVKIGNGWNSATPFGLTDWDKDGHQDIVARMNDNGDLRLYRGQSVRGYSSWVPTKIGNGWNGFSPFGLSDWDRDSHQDIVTRNDKSGDLFLYRGQSVTGYSQLPPVKIGNGWS